jgi:hypothetical protein
VKPAVGALVVTEAADSAEFVGYGTPTLTIHQLVRIVAALPLHQFMSLNHAFAKAKDCLGSGDLAARDLRQHARNRRLTIAARGVFPDDTEQALIFRSAFWRYFEIWPPYPSDSEAVRVRGAITLPGAWYCFVGRRRFDLLYSTADDRRAAREPALGTPSIPQSNNRLAEQKPSSSKPGSAAAWIDELHPNDWHLVTAGKIYQEAVKRGCKLARRTFQDALRKRRGG